jgi:hypothetical protein
MGIVLGSSPMSQAKLRVSPAMWQLPLSESHSMATGKRLILPNRCCTAATIRSRALSLEMPPAVATKLMASRSEQSNAKATQTLPPLSQPISKPSKHQRQLRRGYHAGPRRQSSTQPLVTRLLRRSYTRKGSEVIL